jgi:hypothetical protein
LKGIDENFGVWDGVDVGSDSHDERAGVRQDGERDRYVPGHRVEGTTSETIEPRNERACRGREGW